MVCFLEILQSNTDSSNSVGKLGVFEKAMFDFSGQINVLNKFFFLKACMFRGLSVQLLMVLTAQFGLW